MRYILVVENSAEDRETISCCLASIQNSLAIRYAEDAFQARDLIAQEDPVLILLDIDLPCMSGGEFLGLLMRHHPLPVVVMIKTDAPKHKSLERYQLLGAIRTINKPHSIETQVRFASELSQVLDTILHMKSRDADSKINNSPQTGGASDYCEPEQQYDLSFASQPIVIALGASTGGPLALSEIVRHFYANSPPVLITQHISDRFLLSLVQGLRRVTQMEVAIAKHGMPVSWGHVYVAPPEHHMEIDRSGKIRILSTVATDRFAPSVNVLFNSIARSRHVSVIAALLTGMGDDGAEGLLRLRRLGAKTIAQDRDTCAVFGMPARAIEIRAATEVLPIQQIGSRIVHHCTSLSKEAILRKNRKAPERVVTT